MDRSCCKIRQPWISFLSNWPLPAISLWLPDMCQSSMGGESQIGTNTTYPKHSFISNEGIRLLASSAPQRRVPYDCQILLHAIYIIIQSAVYRTWMGGFLFHVDWLVLVLKIILYPHEREIIAFQYVTGYNLRSERNWNICWTSTGVTLGKKLQVKYMKLMKMMKQIQCFSSIMWKTWWK